MQKAIAATVVLIALTLGHTSVYAQEKWVATWASGQQGTNVTFGAVVPTFSNQTLRQIVRVTKGGSTVRVRFSNAIGSEPIQISAASIAKRMSGAAIDDNSLQQLTFSNVNSVTVPDGAYVLSDPVSLEVDAFEELAISLYLADETAVNTQHSTALQTNYVSTAGDFTASSDFPVESANESWFLLSGVDVLATSDTRVVATFGDSITDGFSSTPDTNNRYPDLLAQRIAEQVENVAVINLGISGNRVLTSVIGPNALSRFDRDVIGRPGVTHVILLEGINDIGLPGLIGAPSQEVSVEQITAGYQQLIRRAHSHDIKLIGATLTPYKSAIYYTEEGDAKRMAVNDWIRSSGAFDGYIDFDLALRDPDNPLTFLPVFDSGDNLHPSDAGYQEMADAIDLALLDIIGDDSVGASVTASRYDAHQGEIFWQRGNYTRFNIFRDQVLQNESPLDASSFYQDTLVSGTPYTYEVVAVDANGNSLESLGTVNMTSENGASGGPATNVVTGERYDRTQGEVFWDKQGYTEFRVYRDGNLVTPENNRGRSFYQNTLVDGQSYVYQVNGVEANADEVSLGQIRMPGTRGAADQL